MAGKRQTGSDGAVEECRVEGDREVRQALPDGAV